MAIAVTMILEGVLFSFMFLPRFWELFLRGGFYRQFYGDLFSIFFYTLLIISLVGMHFRKEAARILHNITIGIFLICCGWGRIKGFIDYPGLEGESLLGLFAVFPFLAVGIWSLYFFNRPKVKEQFK